MSIAIHTMKALPDESGWSVGYWLANVRYERMLDGNYASISEWIEICQFKETLDAVKRVNLLNGGPGNVV